jgi:hypothetical protein
MDSKTFQIKIDSILGGISPATHFAAGDQFLTCLGIDPAQTSNFFIKASGLICPVPTKDVSAANTMKNVPMWITVPQPKASNGTVYVYDYGGSVYTHSARSTPGVTGLGDLNDGGTAHGNGAEYYDNYIYFARDTTIARYGPLDGVATFTDDYWATTLGLTALNDSYHNLTYPVENFGAYDMPNHVMHRHSDGKLYIADVVGNKGTIHYISTSKTTVEGDTNNGSTYSKLTVGYGLWPTAMESYGSNLAIAFFEGQGNVNRRGQRAKIAFWDTTSQNVNQLTWVEFPDPVISAMKNINGTLYVFSGQTEASGCRISRFVGGYTFEEVAYFEESSWPFPGAVDGSSKRLIWGSFTSYPENAGVVYSLGLQKSTLSDGLFGIMRATGGQCNIYSLALIDNFSLYADYPSIGWSKGVSGVTNNGIDSVNGNFTPDYSFATQIWESQIYKIGQPFKIKKIRMPLAQVMGANMTVSATILLDDGASSVALLPATNANDPSAKNIIRRSGQNSEVIKGHHNFWLQLKWTGSSFCAVGLPITIEYELLEDDG